MGKKRRTDGYHLRLGEALREGPKPMSVRGLGRDLSDAYPDIRGASYGGVRQYAAGRVLNPRMELLRAIADVLAVRWEWLAFDDGEMTDALEKARTEVSQQSDAAMAWMAYMDQASREQGAYQEDLADAEEHVHPVLETLGVPVTKTGQLFPSWSAPLARVEHRFMPTRAPDLPSPTRRHPVSDPWAGSRVTQGDIHLALRSFLDALHIDAAQMSTTTLDDYITVMVPVLLSLVPEHHRQDSLDQDDPQENDATDTTTEQEIDNV